MVSDERELGEGQDVEAEDEDFEGHGEPSANIGGEEPGANIGGEEPGANIGGE